MITVAVALSAPATAAAAFHVYVMDAGTSAASEFTVGSTGALSPSSGAPTAKTGAQPVDAVISPDGQNLYTLNDAGDTISELTISPTGALSPSTGATTVSTGTAGDTPGNIAMTPDGLRVYASTVFEEHLDEFTVGPGGALSPTSSPPFVTTNEDPHEIVVSPNGLYAYSADYLSDTVSEFKLGPGDALSPSSKPPTVQTGGEPYSIAITPDGQHLYVANQNDDTISEYSIGSGGLLSPSTDAPTIKTGSFLYEIVISPNGKNLYAVNADDDTVSQYSIGTTGALSALLAAPTVKTGSTPEAMAITPDGRNAFVVNEGDDSVSEYAIGANGALSPSTNAPTVETGTASSPDAIVITPDSGPSASLTDIPALAGGATKFSGQATDPDEPIASYSWSFGDGGTATGASASHVYTRGGQYKVTLTVSDSTGCGGPPAFAGEAGPWTGHDSYCATDPGSTVTRTVTIAAPAKARPLITKARASGSGAAWTFGCIGNTGGPCTVTATLTVHEKRGHKVLASHTSTLPLGSSHAESLSLGRAGLRLLKRFHKLTVTLTITTGRPPKTIERATLKFKSRR